MSKHRTASVLAAAAISVALAGSAAAQQGQQQQGQQQQGRQDSQKSTPNANAPVAGVVPLGVTIEADALLAQGWRASKLLHSPVFNDQNQRIGRVEDFIVSPDEKVSVAVVDVGGFLGLGAHRVAIPFSQLSADTKKVVVKGATKEALRKLPEFKYVA